MSDSQYCPQCREERPTFEFEGEGQWLTRCQVCGFPVNQSLPGERSLEASPVVLHIDDDALARRLVAAMLTRAGFTPLSAPDGESGLELVIRERPAAVFVDLIMPAMDGYQVCQRLRANSDLKSLAIIMLTASEDQDLDTSAFKAGADLAIRKPFDEERLLSILRTALQLKRLVYDS